TEAKSQNLSIYCITINMRCPDCLIDMSNETGGQWFEYVSTKEQARKIYLQIYGLNLVGNPAQLNGQVNPLVLIQKKFGFVISK
ncbi:MAG TPA: hypothetical protein PL149_04360, partial [Candidatus Kapabacteria bacterium]|nr:hypothetical protein [Candidatus Kapabacteria bacterium]